MNKFLDYNGLAYFWGKIKAWGNSIFAPIAHTHTSYAVKHSYTTAANAAKNWYRIANANTSQLDTTKPIRAQFIVTAYNTSYAADYYETWFVNAIVFGRQAHIVIFGGSGVPFSQARILYENTVANIDANDRPAIDLYLSYVLPNGTTKIEVEEIYNSGWTFLANGQLTASSVPSGFESVASTIRNNGIDRSTTADYASYLNRQISNITAAFTLADSYLYRSRTLNCTGTFTITIPSINSGYMWCVIKNKNTSSGVITLHPSTTSVLIDGSNADITLQPMEYVCIHSAGANNFSLIADGRWKSLKANDADVVHTTGTETVTGAKTFSSEVKISSTNALRIKSSNYGAFFRNDNSAFYLLVTTSGDADGTWTTARPLTVNLATGVCSINGNSATATKFASAQSVALTGDVTGSASSQAGWSIATTLANSGVTAGRYTSVSVDAKGRVTAGNVKHSYTTAANAAKNWYRIANANTSQIDTTKPLHLQFFVRAQAQAAGVAYWQSWFVDLEVWGQYSGARIFGNTNAPFSQIRVLYENTAASVTSSTRPAVDLYLNYVLAGGTVVEIEEVYNSGCNFVADGVLATSTVPSDYENRAVQAYASGVNNCGTADYATYHYLYGSNVSTNTTLSASSSNHCYRILNCTGTITLTVPSWNSSSGWFFIKNNGTGVITVHPASTSVMFDNVSADITLQPGEFIRLACQSNNHYSIIDDGRWKTQCIHLPTNVSNPERTVLCADGVWRDISQIAFPIQ